MLFAGLEAGAVALTGGWLPWFVPIAGLPDGDSYAVGTIGHAGRGGKNTVPAGPGRR